MEQPEFFPDKKKEMKPLTAIERKHAEIIQLHSFMCKELKLRPSHVFDVLNEQYFFNKNLYIYQILEREDAEELVERFNPEEASITYRVIMKKHLDRYQ